MLSKQAPVGPTRLLAVIAASMLHVVLLDRPIPAHIEWAHLGIAFGLAALIRAAEGLKAARSQSQAIAFLFVVLITLPFVGDFIQRTVAYSGRPAEIQMVLALRNMMFGLAAATGDRRRLSYAALASCFVALYSLLWLMNGWNIALVFVYTLVGMWWLAAAYWSRLSDCFVSRTERTVPWKPVGVTALAGLVVLGLLIPLARGKVCTTASNGFMPSSGGTKWEDEHAFGGVGDGSQMVSATDDASSFGPIDSELFLESKMPSLYDCFNEFSNPDGKVKKRKKNRAIPLSPSQMKANHERKGINQKPGREFNSVRKRNERRKSPKVDDQPSPALLQVVGRVPVHLGLYTYDLWDGRKLSSSNRSDPFSIYFESRKGAANWVRISSLREDDDVVAHKEHHQVRVINLKTDRVPSPPTLTAVHINKIHTAKLFTTTDDGVLALDMETIPQLTVMHAESLCRRRAVTPFPVQGDEASPVDQVDLVADIAREWTDGVARGWPQVEAICHRLRDEYELDVDSMVPEDVDDAAVYFLNESKRGPSYLFAASTATLLRCLGYETRVVSGFYARPENYDRQANVTPVFAADAHFWVEVLVTSVDESSSDFAITKRYWAPVDATPGYEVLYARESVMSRMMASAKAIWRVIKSHPIGSGALFVFWLIVWLQRAALCDFAVTTWWRIRFRWGGRWASRSEGNRHRVITTLRLVERRCRLHGQPRSKAIPLGRWNPWSDTEFRSWKRFVDIANWALYGGGLVPVQFGTDIDAICSEVALSPIPKRTGQVLPVQQERSL